MEKKEEYGGNVQEIRWDTVTIIFIELYEHNLFYYVQVNHAFFCVVSSSVAESQYFADFPPSARGDQSSGAASCWTGSMCRGINHDNRNQQIKGSNWPLPVIDWFLPPNVISSGMEGV